MPKSGLPKTGALNFIIQKVNLYHFEQNDIIELFCATRLFYALCDFAACVERKISPFALLLRIFSKEPMRYGSVATSMWTNTCWPAWQPLATRRLPSVPQAQMLVREKRNALVAERVKAQEQVPHQGCNSALPLPRTEETGRIHL